MRMVYIAQDARYSFASRNEGVAELKLHVLTAGAREGPVQVNTIGDNRHGRDSITCAPVAVVVFGDCRNGIASRIGGIVPCPIVIYGPVRKLKVAVAPDRVDVKDIGQTQFADAELEPAHWDLRGQ